MFNTRNLTRTRENNFSHQNPTRTRTRKKIFFNPKLDPNPKNFYGIILAYKLFKGAYNIEYSNFYRLQRQFLSSIWYKGLDQACFILSFQVYFKRNHVIITFIRFKVQFLVQFSAFLMQFYCAIFMIYSAINSSP